MGKIIQDSYLVHNKTQKSKIHKWCKQRLLEKDDDVAIESPLEIRLGHDQKNFQTLAITMCTPADIENLIYGYLYTENIITQCKDIIEISIYDNELGLIAEVLLCQSVLFETYLNKRQSVIHASCGVCGKTEIEELLTYNYPRLQVLQQQLDASIICSLPGKLNQIQQAFNKTGGLHACGLFNNSGGLLFIQEDIGRHNALDKLIGQALQKDLLPLSGFTILLSGRVSFELVHKSLMAGLTHLCAIGAPSSLSIDIARVNNLLLTGFVRDTGFNHY